MGEARVNEEDALAGVSDGVLVERAIDGDTVSFAELIRRHGPILRAYATRVLGSADNGDEVTQEALYQAWRDLESLENPSAVRPWLFRIVTRLSLTRLRETPTATAPPSPATDATRPAVERLTVLAAVLDELPEAERQCWLLREMADLGYDEIAESIGITVEEVRGCLARARAALYARTEEWR